MRSAAYATRLALGALELLATQLRDPRRPFVVNHLVTVRCNLRCPFCYVSGPEQDAFNRVHYPKRDELSTAETRAFYRQLVDAGFKLAVVLGGEPLLRPDFGEMLAELRGRVLVNVFTNGLLLAERHELVRDASTVFVSIDGPGVEHDRIRVHDGLFDRAMDGIDTLRRKHPAVRIALNATITRNNASRVPELLAIAKRQDLPIGFQPPSYEGQFTVDDRPFDESARNAAEQAEVGAAFRLVRDAAQRGERVIGSRAFFDHVIENRPGYDCLYPTYVLGPVMPNGDVVGCTSSRVIGNVRTTPVRELVKSTAFRENAQCGRACEVGCRDWGIHDLSAAMGRKFRPSDARRYFRCFVA